MLLSGSEQVHSRFHHRTVAGAPRGDVQNGGKVEQHVHHDFIATGKRRRQLQGLVRKLRPTLRNEERKRIYRRIPRNHRRYRCKLHRSKRCHTITLCSFPFEDRHRTGPRGREWHKPQPEGQTRVVAATLRCVEQRIRTRVIPREARRHRC